MFIACLLFLLLLLLHTQTLNIFSVFIWVDSTPHHSSRSVKAVPFHEYYAKLLANRTKLRQKQNGEVKTKTLQYNQQTQSRQLKNIHFQNKQLSHWKLQKQQLQNYSQLKLNTQLENRKKLWLTTPEETTPVLIGVDLTPNNSNGSVKTVPFKEYYAKLLVNRTKLCQEQYGEVKTKTWQLTNPIQTTPEKTTLRRTTPEQATPGLSTPEQRTPGQVSLKNTPEQRTQQHTTRQQTTEDEWKIV